MFHPDTTLSILAEIIRRGGRLPSAVVLTNCSEVMTKEHEYMEKKRKSMKNHAKSKQKSLINDTARKQIASSSSLVPPLLDGCFRIKKEKDNHSFHEQSNGDDIFLLSSPQPSSTCSRMEALVLAAYIKLATEVNVSLLLVSSILLVT